MSGTPSNFASASTTVDPPRIGLVGKLLARALDPAAPEPEAINSAEKLVRVARCDCITLVDVARHLAIVHPQDRERRPRKKKLRRPVAADRVIKFGMHNGKSLEEIGRTDPQYLTWLAAECRIDAIRADAEIVADYLDKLRAREGA